MTARDDFDEAPRLTAEQRHILALWDAGRDTLDIARALRIGEGEAERRTRAARDHRRRERGGRS